MQNDTHCLTDDLTAKPTADEKHPTGGKNDSKGAGDQQKHGTENHSFIYHKAMRQALYEVVGNVYRAKWIS